ATGLEPKSARLPGAVIVRGAAESALDECSGGEVHALLLDTSTAGARHPEDRALRAAAVRALGGTREAVFWPVLAELLAEPDAQLRATAARALGDLGNHRAVPHVTRALCVEGDPVALQAMVETLRVLLAIAQRAGELDPLMQIDASRAVAGALARTTDWRVAADLVRFLDRHRTRDAIPALIEVLARTEGRPGDDRGRRFLQNEAHRTLRAMTGAVFGAADVDRWRAMWETGKDTLQIVPLRQQAEHEKATVAGSFFGIPVLGRRVVFILDRSGSMGAAAPQPQATAAGDAGVPTRLDIARQECWNAVADMGPDTFFNVVVFSDRARAWKGELVPATVSNKSALRTFLERLVPNGSTNLWDALATAIEMRTAISEGRQREPVDEIFVLSDGYPSSGEVTDAATITLRIAELNRHAGIRINTVFIGSQESELDRYAQPGGAALMKTLAQQNGGSHVER
ncbi:MAG TPA: HEAT repeat domain-containing protein, partial [Planctomycetota bacterium]|nr:HEAT repeat domain-containing protein [Planctomycetota bacterium]